MRILGIESSCDETAASVVEDGRKILSNVVASQIDVHAEFGGVVPELAARYHLDAISPVVRKALSDSNVTLEEIDVITATQGPGLMGALLCGFCFAKSLSFATGIDFLGSDHLEGHLLSVLLMDSPPSFPYVALLASGGHTAIYYVTSPTTFEKMGQTLDDAVGEAYDKVSKAMSMGYPGGKKIDDLAQLGDSTKIHFPRTYLDKEKFDFSFSGIKTAVGRYLETCASVETEKKDIAASFQQAVIEVLSHKLLHAAKVKNCKTICVVGGVAANRGLKEHLEKETQQRGWTFCVPPLSLCGDNAAMIAASAYWRYQNGERSSLSADTYSRHRHG